MAMEQSGSGLDTVHPAGARRVRLWPQRAAVIRFLHAHSVARFTFATVLCFSLVMAPAWFWAVNGRMSFLDPEYAMWVAKMELAAACNTGDTVVLGDSRAMADLIPDRIGSMTNLALGGSTPVEAFYLAKKLTSCPTPPKRVILSITPRNFMQAEIYWSRAALFGFYNFDQMEEIRHVSWRLRDPSMYPSATSGVGLDDIVKDYGYAVSLPSYYFPAMLSGRFVARKDTNVSVLEDTIRARGHHLFGEAESVSWPNDDIDLNEFEPTPVMAHYFDRTLAHLDEHGIEVLYMVMPVNERTHAGTKTAVREGFADYLAAAAAKYANFRVLGGLAPMLADHYFGDVEHLNARGAQLWSDHVKSKLSETRSASQ